jgi:hypothetical protein
MKGLSKSPVKFMLHPAWWHGEIAERVQDGPIVRTKIKCDKVVVITVPYPACRGYVDPLASFRVGEVAGASSTSGGFSRGEHLV